MSPFDLHASWLTVIMPQPIPRWDSSAVVSNQWKHLPEDTPDKYFGRRQYRQAEKTRNSGFWHLFLKNANASIWWSYRFPPQPKIAGPSESRWCAIVTRIKSTVNDMVLLTLAEPTRGYEMTINSIFLEWATSMTPSLSWVTAGQWTGDCSWHPVWEPANSLPEQKILSSKHVW